MAHGYPLEEFNTVKCNKNKIHSFDTHGKPKTWNVSWEKNCETVTLIKTILQVISTFLDYLVI